MTNEEFKRTLWEAADKLRGSVAAATYKYPVLGLVFLKYVSDMFDAQGRAIRHGVSEPQSPYYVDDKGMRSELAEQFATDKTFYDADNVFWVQPKAHFNTLLAQAAAPDLAQKLDKALGEIEAENPSLKGVLYREFSRLELEPGKLGELMQLLARLSFDPERHGSRDVSPRRWSRSPATRATFATIAPAARTHPTAARSLSRTLVSTAAMRPATLTPASRMKATTAGSTALSAAPMKLASAAS